MRSSRRLPPVNCLAASVSLLGSVRFVPTIDLLLISRIPHPSASQIPHLAAPPPLPHYHHYDRYIEEVRRLKEAARLAELARIEAARVKAEEEARHREELAKAVKVGSAPLH